MEVWIFILINSCLVYLFIFGYVKKRVAYVIFIAYILRFSLSIVDFYHIFPVLHSGSDTETFHNNALQIMCIDSFNFSTLTNYELFLGGLYRLLGPVRLLALNINNVLGIIAIIYVYKSLILLDISNKLLNISIIILSFFPHSVIFSSILLREAWVSAFVSISLYYFIRWFQGGRRKQIMLSCIFLLIASIMHSGVIVFSLAYILAFISYNRKKVAINISMKSLIPIFISTIIILIVLSSNQFTQHFNGLSDEEQLFDKINYKEEVGSAYLTSIKVNSALDVLIYAPLKMIYFQFSPLPLDWRGFTDFIAFILDSLIYLYLIISIIMVRKYIWKYKSRISILFRYIIIGYALTILVFSFGTIASGTAIRHRNKLLPVLIITYAIALNTKRKYIYGDIANNK